MNKSKNGGYADYDDPDFDSEWFDDEAYDRALAQGYDEDAYDARAASPAPSARGRQGPPSRARGNRTAAWPLVLGSIAAVVLAAGAGYYVVATFADSGFIRRIHTAYQVLRGGAPAMVVESPQPAPLQGPGDILESPAEALKRPELALGVPSATSSAVAALPTASSEAATETPDEDFGPGGPVATSGGVLSSLASAPQRVDAPSSPLAVIASPPAPLLASSSAPAKGSRLLTSAKPVALLPSPRLSSGLARKPVASPPASRVPSAAIPTKRLKLAFAPGTVALSGAHVEAMWTFANGLEGQSGRYLVQGYLGYGRLAPNLAQQRAQAVAGVLRRQQGRARTPVDVRVMSQPVQGVAGRQVEIIFTPQLP